MVERLDKKIMELFEVVRNVYPEIGHFNVEPYSEYSANGYSDTYSETYWDSYRDIYIDHTDEKPIGKIRGPYIKLTNMELVIQRTLAKKYIRAYGAGGGKPHYTDHSNDYYEVYHEKI